MRATFTSRWSTVQAAQVAIWNVTEERPPTTFPGHGTRNGVAFSPDGAYLAHGGPDKAIIVRDARTDAEVLRITERPPGTLTQLHFVAESKRLLGAFDSRQQVLWEVPSGKEVKRYSNSTVILSHDGNWLARTGAEAGTFALRVEDFAEQKVRFNRPETHPLAFSPDGRFLAATERGDHTQPVHSVVFSADGNRLISAGNGEVITRDAGH